MEARALLDTPIATADRVTLTLSGSFDPIATLPDRLLSLAMLVPTPEGPQLPMGLLVRWTVDLQDLLTAAEAARRGDASTVDVAQHLQSSATRLVEDALRLRTQDENDLTAELERLAAVLRNLAVTCQLGAPTVLDGNALMTAFARTLDLASIPEDASPSPAGGEHSPIFRFGYGSPWYVEAGVVLGSGGSIVALAYGIKEISGLDLVIRLRRAELRTQLEEAEQKLKRIRALGENEHTEWIDQANVMPTEEELRERHGLRARIERISFFPWLVKRALLSDEDSK